MTNSSPQPFQPDVDELTKLRKRADAAERILEDFKSEIKEKNTRLQEQEEVIGSLQRRQRIDELLAESQAIDVESTRLLTEMTLEQMDDAEIEDAVEELRRRKPMLFRTARSTHSALAPHIESESAPDAQRAASIAQSTGNRNDLLHYLRLRRKC